MNVRYEVKCDIANVKCFIKLREVAFLLSRADCFSETAIN